MKGVISTYTLETSVRLRSLMDTLAKTKHADALRALEELVTAGVTIATVDVGDFPMTLREACNKIIHARSAVPIWSDAGENGRRFQYWSGDYALAGTHRGEAWAITLNFAEWSAAAERFLTLAERQQLTTYIGQDWPYEGPALPHYIPELRLIHEPLVNLGVA